jgi:hypothetical protein
MRGAEPADPHHRCAPLRALGADVARREAQTTLHVCGTQEGVQKVLDRTGLGGLFPSHPDRATAIAAF